MSLVRLLGFLAALFLFLETAPCRAESLLELYSADPLADHGAPEAQPRTRRGQVIYPAAGVPSVVRPGREIVARIRVRRAMTPPPGIQQRHFLVPWQAWITNRSLFAAPETTGSVEIPLTVVQIRPEDEGFVYRIRLEIPAFAPRGVYDLTVRGPGLFDVASRAVRVIPDNRETLELYVVGSGDALWDEGEGLSLLDPDLLLVPGNILEASIPLSRWPLATFAVPSPQEVSAHRCLDLSDEMARAVLAAVDCPDEGSAAARCVTAALGGVEALDVREDHYLTYLRRVGPTPYVVGLGAVTLVGANTFAHPDSELSALSLRLGDRRVRAPAPADPTRPFLGPAQGDWIRRHRALSSELLVLGFHHVAEFHRPSTTTRPPRAEAGLRWVTNESTAVEANDIAGPAIIRLRRRPRPPLWDLEQTWGLDPGVFAIEEISPRPPATSAGTTQRISPNSLLVEVRNAPAGRLFFRFLVPATGEGWTLETIGRVARLTSAAPAGRDLCEMDQVLLEAEVEPGEAGPLRLELRRVSSQDSIDPRIELREPASGLSVGRPVKLRARLEGFAGSAEGGDPDYSLLWTLGDGAEASGLEVSHRYIRSGPSRICVVALDLAGRAASAETTLDVRSRASVASGGRAWLARWLCGALGAFALFVMLLGWIKGNIFQRRRRWSSGMEAR